MSDQFIHWWEKSELLYSGDSGLCALRAWQFQQKKIDELQELVHAFTKEQGKYLADHVTDLDRIEQLQTFVRKVSNMTTLQPCHNEEARGLLAPPEYKGIKQNLVTGKYVSGNGKTGY